MLYKHTYSAQSPLVFQLDEYKNSLLSSETDSEIPNRYLKQKFTGIIAVPEKKLSVVLYLMSITIFIIKM